MIAFSQDYLYTKKASDTTHQIIGINFAALGGEAAVPCTRNPL